MSLSLPPGMTLVRELGRGRLGATALCRDAAGDEVVVTELEVRPADERVRRELEVELHAAAAAFDHPCAVVPRLLGGGGQAMYLLQPYLPGGSLGSDAISVERVTVGAARLVAALAQGHANGMLHGDVRPSNVLRTSDGAWVLTAGGVARAVGRAGSEAAAHPDQLFAAPEHFSGEQPGAAADVYSLGATLYAALVGQAPHADAAIEGAGALYAARLVGPPELPLAVPASLAALVKRMLAPDAAERPALPEVDQVLRSLVPAGAPLPPPIPAPSLPVPPRPAVRLAVTEPAAVTAASKRRTLVAAVAIGAIFLVGAGTVAATTGEDEDRADLAAAVAAVPAPSPAVAPIPPKATPRPTKKSPNGVTANGPAAGSVERTTAAPRGVGMRIEDARAVGLVASRIKVFEYRDRLVVLWDMKPLAREVVRFDLYTVAGASDRAPIYDGTELRGKAGRYGHVFRTGVDASRCVQIAYVVRNGAPLSDGRTTCTSPPDAKELDTAYAEAAARHQGIQFSPPEEKARPT